MYHNLMNGGMGPAWTPEMIGKLTPLQVMCMVCKSPPKPGETDLADAMEVAKQAELAWRE